MNQELIQKLQYSYGEQHETHPLPLSLKDSLQLISEFFKHNTTNKLCLVFPSREYAAQWLSIPTVLFLIESDFIQFNSEITESYKQYKPSDKLILNNKAIVEWVGIKEKEVGGEIFKGPTFKTKHIGGSSGAEITIRFSDVIKLQKAPSNRQSLSSIKTVKETLPLRNITPIEKLLKIDTFGNKEFIKNKICLVSKYKSFNDSIDLVTLNLALLYEYFQAGKIKEDGTVKIDSPLLISSNLSNLALSLTQSCTVSKIIIDGYSAIYERGTDFSDIDGFKIPTILITDLSEIESFENIGNYGFEFFNFTKENIAINEINNQSPFETFEKKLSNYVFIKFEKEVCINLELETASQKLHSLPEDDSNNDLNILKISLIQLSNFLSRICYVPEESEISNYSQKILNIESHFLKCKLWLGNANKPIEEIISVLKYFVEQLAKIKTEKCIRLEELMKQSKYDYIICATEEEANSLAKHINATTTSVIPVADVNDNLLTGRNIKAILTGWPKSSNLNRILSSFLFTELTLLLYQFENKYYNSLQRRNRKFSENIKATVNKSGIRSTEEESKTKGFEELYLPDEIVETSTESLFDIVEFELKLDNTQYSKYSARGNLAESCKAKRIGFESNTFIYATELHKFIVINELIDSAKSNPNIHSKRFEALQTGDVIAFINTDRDVLVELVQKNTKPDELAAIRNWTDLWKNLLREYYSLIGYDFIKLVEDLRKYDCKKHNVTIKNWLQDDNLIGPDSNDDLLSIAMLANSELLYNNVLKVREAINQMTSLRFQAATIVRDKIKNKLMAIADTSIINTSTEIQDLGRVDFLKISELKKESEEIDKRYVHRLISKEII